MDDEQDAKDLAPLEDVVAHAKCPGCAANCPGGEACPYRSC